MLSETESMLFKLDPMEAMPPNIPSDAELQSPFNPQHLKFSSSPHHKHRP